VKAIILTPEAGELKIDVRGDLAGILAVSLKTKTPAISYLVYEAACDRCWLFASRRDWHVRHAVDGANGVGAILHES
jgi:hypothetical protein